MVVEACLIRLRQLSDPMVTVVDLVVELVLLLGLTIITRIKRGVSCGSRSCRGYLGGSGTQGWVSSTVESLLDLVNGEPVLVNKVASDHSPEVWTNKRKSVLKSTLVNGCKLLLLFLGGEGGKCRVVEIAEIKRIEVVEEVEVMFCEGSTERGEIFLVNQEGDNPTSGVVNVEDPAVINTECAEFVTDNRDFLSVFEIKMSINVERSLVSIEV